jgi:SAM-dependent methyltransferase
LKDSLFSQLRSLPYFRGLLRAVESEYYQQLPLPAPVYDLGCGDGHFASVAFRHPIDVGIDPSRAPIREARRHGAYRLLVQADAGRAPFPTGWFASAFSNSVLEHVPALDAVLRETARILRPGAPFYLCVPNPRYLTELSLPALLGSRYARWFRRITRVVHLDEPAVWQRRLESAGFDLVRQWHYFSPASMRVLEWGHYFGLPSLLARLLTGRWIITPARWNLWLTGKLIEKYASSAPLDNGAFTFYVARRRDR